MLTSSSHTDMDSDVGIHLAGKLPVTFCYLKRGKFWSGWRVTQC